MASNTGQTLLALLTGAAIGAGIGILYAPDKGSKTRKQISKEAKKARKQLDKHVKETSSNLSEKAQKAWYCLCFFLSLKAGILDRGYILRIFQHL